MLANDIFRDLPGFSDISRPADRTILYSLTPIGLGTPLQESLLSFLIRVSRAHAVNPRRLVGEILVQDNSAIGQLAYAGFYKKLAKTVNGIGQYAELFATVLEHATGTGHLRRLTLLPWQDMFPFNGQGTLAAHPQWCPNCLLAQCSEVGERYIPLVWTLAACKMCPIHDRTLETRCPHCGKHQSFIPRFPDSGICSECGSFLVTETILNAKRHAPASRQERWAADAVFAMIARQSSQAALPTDDDFRVFIADAVDQRAGGNRAALCKRIGLRGWAFKGWLTKGKKPSMAQFLDVCCRFGVSPAHIGSEKDAAAKELTSPSYGKRVGRKPCRRLTAGQRKEIRAKLDCCLAEEAALPVSTIASKLGVTARCLRYWFPEQCAALTARARLARADRSTYHQAKQQQQVKAVVQQLRQVGRNASRRQVSSAIRKEGMSLAQPHLLKAYREAVAS